jgi:hypothetical protein
MVRFLHHLHLLSVQSARRSILFPKIGKTPEVSSPHFSLSPQIKGGGHVEHHAETYDDMSLKSDPMWKKTPASKHLGYNRSLSLSTLSFSFFFLRVAFPLFP